MFWEKKIIKGVCIFSVFPHFCSMLEFNPLLALITADLWEKLSKRPLTHIGRRVYRNSRNQIKERRGDSGGI